MSVRSGGILEAGSGRHLAEGKARLGRQGRWSARPQCPAERQDPRWDAWPSMEQEARTDQVDVAWGPLCGCRLMATGNLKARSVQGRRHGHTWQSST